MKWSTTRMYEEKLLEISTQLHVWVKEVEYGGWSTYHVMPMIKLRESIQKLLETEQEVEKEKTDVTYEQLISTVSQKLLSYCGNDWWMKLDHDRDARKIVDMVRSWEPKKL